MEFVRMLPSARLAPLVLVLILLALASVPANRVTAATLPPPKPRSYAALGASETYGIGASSAQRSYAYRVAAALKAKPFVDVAIPGVTLPEGYENELTAALAARPALCTLFFGVNDLRARVHRSIFLADLRDLSATLHQAGARVLIIGLPELTAIPAVQAAHLGNLPSIVHSWNVGMRRVAAKTGAKYLDLTAFGRELAAHPNYIAADGLHPSDAGNKRLAQVVVTAIRHDKLWGHG